MEEGVYIYSQKEGNIRQITFMKVTYSGIAYGIDQYSTNSITFTMVEPDTIFPAFREKNKNYIEDEIFKYTPLVINEYKLQNLSANGPLYDFYVKNYTKCNVSFRLIQHLFENFNSIKDTFKCIIKEYKYDE